MTVQIAITEAEAVAPPPPFEAGSGPSVSARNVDLIALHLEHVGYRMEVAQQHLRDGYVHRVRRELYGARQSINRMMRAVNTRGTM